MAKAFIKTYEGKIYNFKELAKKCKSFKASQEEVAIYTYGKRADRANVKPYLRRVVAESNSIDELLELYIIDGEICDKGFDKESVKDKESATDIYGLIRATGIKNEPVLKTVAKLNKNGQWELLYN